MRQVHTHAKKVVMVILVTIVLSTVGCMLQPADDANVIFSVPQDLGASGYYGDLPDVDRVEITVRGGATDPDTGLGSLYSSLEMSADTGWEATAADVPTMTTLTIEAIAYGRPTHSYFGEWEFTSDEEQVLFSGVTERMITTASAQVYLSMRPYDDGSLQRLPRIEQMRSNLNEMTLEFDLKGYGDTEDWYWRIIDDEAEAVATDSFSSTSGAVQFPGSAADELETVSLDYLAPTNESGKVDWLDHLYVLEIANPQHNVLRQSFVVNPGSSGAMDVNFAPWIQNITAGRYSTEGLDYDGAFAAEESVVRWIVDAVDEDSPEMLRYLWILDLNYTGDGSVTVGYGDIDTANDTGDLDALLSGIEGLYSSADPFGGDRRAVSALLLDVMTDAASSSGAAIGDTAELPDVSNTTLGSDVFIVPGDWFDHGSITGDLYLIVADTEFQSATEDQTYDDYSWSYVKMELDGSSFPALGDGSNGIIRFVD